MKLKDVTANVLVCCLASGLDAIWRLPGGIRGQPGEGATPATDSLIPVYKGILKAHIL